MELHRGTVSRFHPSTEGGTLTIKMRLTHYSCTCIAENGVEGWNKIDDKPRTARNNSFGRVVLNRETYPFLDMYPERHSPSCFEDRRVGHMSAQPLKI